jgi:hypothetical protein
MDAKPSHIDEIQLGKVVADFSKAIAKLERKKDVPASALTPRP